VQGSDQGNDKPKKHDCPRITCTWNEMEHLRPLPVLATLFEPDVTVARLSPMTVVFQSEGARRAHWLGQPLLLSQSPADPSVYTGRIPHGPRDGPPGVDIVVVASIVDEVATVEAFAGRTFPRMTRDDAIRCTKGRTPVVPAP
jgi:hypothetical protein